MNRLMIGFFLSFSVHTAVIFFRSPANIDPPRAEVTRGKSSISVFFKKKTKKIKPPRKMDEFVTEKILQPVEPLSMPAIDESPTEVPVENEPIEASKEEKEQFSEKETAEEEIPDISSVESQGVQWIEPQYRKNRAPKYPRQALLNNIEGIVQLIVWIDEKGYPASVKVEKSSKSHLLDQAALNAVKEWQFVPAEREGKGIKSKARIPIHFKIERH